MIIKACSIAVALVLAGTPAGAQDLPTDQLDRHAETVRHNSVLRSNLRQSYARQNGRNVNRSSSQAAACANRARFSRQYGADHPKVRKLHALCARAGY